MWLVLLGLGGCAGQAGGRSPPPAPSTQLLAAPQKEPDRCRAALADEARQLAGAIRQEAPDSVLSQGLQTFSEQPVVTKESLENIGILRNLLKHIGFQDKGARLEQAATKTTASCQTIDSPEQRAQDAVDEAIELLAAENYKKMVERFTPPPEFKQLKSSGRFEAVVAQLQSGWGRVLLEKLQASRIGPPLINKNGTISFHIPGLVGMLSEPLTLVERGGRWYFSEQQEEGAPAGFGGRQEQLVAA